MLRFQWKHHPRERVAGHPKKRSSRAAPGFARWRTGVTQPIPGAAAEWLACPRSRREPPGAIACGAWPCRQFRRLHPDQGSARSRARHSRRLQGRAARPAADAPPTLDWWRGFRSAELTTLMEEAQTVNLDIAAATARFMQADAQARIAGAALLPSLNGSGSGDLFPHLGLERQRPDQWRPRGGQLFGLAQRQLSSSISGARTATPRRPRKRPRSPTASIATSSR